MHFEHPRKSEDVRRCGDQEAGMIRSKPERLAPQANSYFYRDASSDGKKFIFSTAPTANAAAQPTRFTVVLNWPSLLKK